MRLLKIQGVSKRFGGLQAVSDLTLAMDEGDVVGLIGPNGAGKTTAFNMISGFLAPDSGDIRFRGHSLVGLRPHQICHLGLTRTFQIVRPFPHLSVLENVKVGAFARTASSGQAAAKARQVLREVGLEVKAGVPAGELTLADRKRLELARALATDPILLLLDEVMAGLNAAETERIVELIRGINARGVSILLIEHVMRAVMSLSSRVAVLNYGELIAEGPPAQVVKAPNVIEAYLGEEYVGASQA